MKRIPLFLLALFIFIQFDGLGQKDPKAKAILDKVSSKYKSMKGYEATFSYNLYNPIADMDEVMEGKITVGGQKYNLQLDNQVIIVNGKTIWTVMKEEEEVNVMEYEPEEGEITPQNIYTMYETGYKYNSNGTIKEDGKTYEVVDLSPENTNNEFFKIRITIDPTNYTIKKWKIFEKSGSRYTYTIKTFKELSNVPSSKFVFNKANYPNFELNDMR